MISGGSVAPVTTARFNVTASASGAPTSTTGSSPTSSTPPPSSSTNPLTPPPATSPTKGAFVTHTLLTAKSTASAFGHPVTFTATVKIIGSARAVAGGAVTFTDRNIVLGIVPLRDGKSSFTTASLPIGAM